MGFEEDFNKRVEIVHNGPRNLRQERRPVNGEQHAQLYWTDVSFPDYIDNDSFEFVPKECKHGETYCDDRTHPTTIIDKVVQRDGHQDSDLFGLDFLPPDPSLTYRFGGLNESSACESRRIVIYPKTALSVENTWRYIVNSDKFQQGLVVERCM